MDSIGQWIGGFSVESVFWLAWTAAHVIGFFIVKRINNSRRVMSFSKSARLIVWGLVVGCVIGMMEWFTLFAVAPWSGWWALATMGGYMGGYITGELVQGQVGRKNRSGIVGRRVAGQVVFGAIVGILQAAVLWPVSVTAACWWIVTSSVCLAGADTMAKAAIRAGLPVRFALILLGVSIGASTGWVLVGLDVL